MDILSWLAFAGFNLAVLAWAIAVLRYSVRAALTARRVEEKLDELLHRPEEVDERY